MPAPSQPTSTRIPLYYTFGNHMHWVDMEWLWGYNVLPDSARDMLRFCAETGAKGNLNFDGIGYEKLAAEAPEALAEVRQAVAVAQVELVGPVIDGDGAMRPQHLLGLDGHLDRNQGPELQDDGRQLRAPSIWLRQRRWGERQRQHGEE